ncbi:MAG: hypothetical protein ACJASX_003879 [Limisphaerales bacterium]
MILTVYSGASTQLDIRLKIFLCLSEVNGLSTTLAEPDRGISGHFQTVPFFRTLEREGAIQDIYPAHDRALRVE